MIDPPGNIPLFLAALRSVPEKRGRAIVLREMIIALGVMVLFALGGGPLLAIFGIQITSIGVSGGVILFLIALKMLFPETHGPMIPTQSGEPFLFPLAIPLIAGPSILATLIELGRIETTFVVITALVGAWCISTVILVASSQLQRLLGDSGLAACEKVMGLVLLLFAVQMILDGLQATFPSELFARLNA